MRCLQIAKYFILKRKKNLYLQKKKKEKRKTKKKEEERNIWLILSVTWLKNIKKIKKKEEEKKSYCVQLISNSSHLQMIPAASNFCQNAFC